MDFRSYLMYTTYHLDLTVDCNVYTNTMGWGY